MVSEIRTLRTNRLRLSSFDGAVRLIMPRLWKVRVSLCNIVRTDGIHYADYIQLFPVDAQPMDCYYILWSCTGRRNGSHLTAQMRRG